MPLFRRHDGDPVPGLPASRRIMPIIMRRRNESIVLHDSVFPIAGARRWLRAYNRSHPAKATLFHLMAYGCASALHARPELNRFVSGGRIYQRRGVQLAFVAKREMSDTGELATVKLEVGAAETFPGFVAAITAAIAASRGAPRAIDRETSLFAAIPVPILRAAFRLILALDDWNLLPRWFTRDDPMFVSLFLANLGSAGVSDAYHHLYEYGSCSLFGALSAPQRIPVVEGGAVVVQEVLRVRWSFDERINDGFYSARSLALVQRLLEDPARFLGAPEGTPAFAPGAAPPP
jgi:hypothetical protein